MVLQDGTEKRTKDTYGPPIGKRLMIFLDDLNMPRMDQYGTQQPIALLKLLIDRKVSVLDVRLPPCYAFLVKDTINVRSPALSHGQAGAKPTRCQLLPTQRGLRTLCKLSAPNASSHNECYLQLQNAAACALRAVLLLLLCCILQSYLYY